MGGDVVVEGEEGTAVVDCFAYADDANCANYQHGLKCANGGTNEDDMTSKIGTDDTEGVVKKYKADYRNDTHVMKKKNDTEKTIGMDVADCREYINYANRPN